VQFLQSNTMFESMAAYYGFVAYQSTLDLFLWLQRHIASKGISLLFQKARKLVSLMHHFQINTSKNNKLH